MRVVHAISGIDPSNGGPTVALLGLTSALAAEGIDVEVVATYQRDEGRDNAAAFEGAGVKVTMVGRAYGKLSKHPDLRRALRERIAQADIVHAHGVWEQMQHDAAIVAGELGKPLVVAPHGMLDEWNMARGRWRKALFYRLRVRPWLKRATLLHAIAPPEARGLARLALPGAIITEPCGLDAAEFASPPPPGFLRARFPELGTRPIVLFLSRMDAKKGLDLLLPAFAKVAQPDGPALVLAGPDFGGYETTVRTLVRKLELDRHVHFTGMLRGPERLAALADATLFALTSHAENFGIALIEAMAAGKAVLASDGVAAATHVTQSGGGRVVPRDVDAIGVALHEMLSLSDQQRAELGRRGRDHVLSTLTWPPIARRWIAHYERLRLAIPPRTN